MEGTIELRAAELADAGMLCELQRLCPGAADWSEEGYRGLLPLEGIICLLAEDLPQSCAVGFLLTRTIADEMEILNLAVIPAYRRRSLARQLVNEASRRAHAQGARRCWLEVRASNQVALAFYRSLGFRAHSRRPNYYRNPVEAAVLCVRQLEASGVPVLPSRRGLDFKNHPE